MNSSRADQVYAKYIENFAETLPKHPVGFPSSNIEHRIFVQSCTAVFEQFVGYYTRLKPGDRLEWVYLDRRYLDAPFYIWEKAAEDGFRLHWCRRHPDCGGHDQAVMRTEPARKGP